jgi:hypothetical protein
LDFVSTSSFRNSLTLLTKRPDSGYKSCPKDLCNALKDLSFEDIFNRNFLIREMGPLRVIKIRVQNSDLKYSSAAGYRAIIACNVKYDHVAFLEIYPKKGKYSKADLRKNEYKEIIDVYGKELKSGTLVKHDITKDLIQI